VPKKKINEVVSAKDEEKAGCLRPSLKKSKSTGTSAPKSAAAIVMKK
jgi:hypothetical protein